MPESEIATLAGGCFWCLEAVFKEVKGVRKVVSGYTGGITRKPTYEEVCTDQTGHAEAVQITFNPAVITYRELLDIFFTIHDPTSLNRQGNDIGTQYRSAIFYHDETQKTTAAEVMKELAKTKIYAKRLVTELKPLEVFYPAEAYHRDYLKKHPEKPYCQAVVAPKVNKFRQKWADKLNQPG